MCYSHLTEEQKQKKDTKNKIIIGIGKIALANLNKYYLK